MNSRYTKQTVDFTEKNRRSDILNFDTDNLYPFHTENLVNNSGITFSSTDIYSRFIYGRGLPLNIWKTKVNRDGLTADKFLRYVITDYSMHKGFAMWIGYNALYDITDIKPIPFLNLRLKTPDDNGNVNKIKYSTNWINSSLREEDIKVYDTYNPDKEVIAMQVLLAGGFDKWKGQIYYFGENGGLEYPLNPFNSVIADVVTDIQIALGKNSNAMTNFMASCLFELPFRFDEIAGTPSDQKKYKKDFMENLEGFQGYDNAGKYMLIENSKADINGAMREMKVHKLDLQDYSKIFEYTENSVQEKIRRCFKIPKILLDPVSAGFSTEIMESMYNYYNEMTSMDRQIFEEFAMQFIGIFAKSSDYSLTPLKFINNG